MKLAQPIVPKGRVDAVMRRLGRAIEGFEEPAVEKIAEAQQEDPFQVLIATMLSAQTRDAVTHDASTRLFKVARTPRTMAKLTEAQIERLIYPVSFYRNKAVHVKEACHQIVSRFAGRVPTTMEELLTLPGVGRKTANLVLILAHRSQENICVDTHVHRISNRLGMGGDADAGGNRAGALHGHATEMVAAHQPLSRHLGSERLSPRLPALRPLRDFQPLRANRRQSACGPSEAPLRSCRRDHFVAHGVSELPLRPDAVARCRSDRRARDRARERRVRDLPGRSA